MMKVWKKHSFGILLSTYFIGMMVAPGPLWYRAGCREQDTKSATLCVMYGTLLWPAAIPAIVVFKVGQAIFYAWEPR